MYLQRIEKADYKSSEHYKKLKRRAGAKRKGFEDKKLETKGKMYCSGAFDIPEALKKIPPINSV